MTEDGRRIFSQRPRSADTEEAGDGRRSRIFSQRPRSADTEEAGDGRRIAKVGRALRVRRIAGVGREKAQEAQNRSRRGHRDHGARTQRKQETGGRIEELEKVEGGGLAEDGGRRTADRPRWAVRSARGGSAAVVS
jgi:hypothetical protein